MKQGEVKETKKGNTTYRDFYVSGIPIRATGSEWKTLMARGAKAKFPPMEEPQESDPSPIYSNQF